MRYTPILSAAIALFFVTASWAQEPSTNSEEQSVRQLVQQYVKARNDKSAEETRAVLTEDADQLVSTGEWRRGRDAFVQGAMRSSQKETGKSEIKVESVRFLTPDIAIADGPYLTASTGVAGSRKMWTTLVLQRTHGAWRISAIRNMLPSPAKTP